MIFSVMMYIVVPTHTRTHKYTPTQSLQTNKHALKHNLQKHIKTLKTMYAVLAWSRDSLSTHTHGVSGAVRDVLNHHSRGEKDPLSMTGDVFTRLPPVHYIQSDK